MTTMKILTIGFTKKNAEKFFTGLRSAGVARVVDTRLNNTSQLAGFAKRDDLRYLLKAVAGIDYRHEPLMAPTAEILEAYKKGRIDWDVYARHFLDLMAARHIESAMSREILADGCLLCSEDKPHHCHRRLVAEYLREHWGDVEIVHLA
jgi:uncharacterized protein (DUF488 family)